MFGNLADRLFECYRFLYDYEGWEDDWRKRIPNSSRVMSIAYDEMIEQIRAFEFRGYQFEPPDEEGWERFCDRVQGRNIFEDL